MLSLWWTRQSYWLDSLTYLKTKCGYETFWIRTKCGDHVFFWDDEFLFCLPFPTMLAIEPNGIWHNGFVLFYKQQFPDEYYIPNAKQIDPPTFIVCRRLRKGNFCPYFNDLRFIPHLCEVRQSKVVRGGNQQPYLISFWGGVTHGRSIVHDFLITTLRSPFIVEWM